MARAGGCPPLPTITTNRATRDDWTAVYAHFRCMRSSPQGTITPAMWERAGKEAQAWMFAQLSKFARPILTEEGRKRVELRLERESPLIPRQRLIDAPAIHPQATTTRKDAVTTAQRPVSESVSMSRVAKSGIPGKGSEVSRPSNLRPGTRTSAGLLDAVIGGIGGFVTGGPAGAIAGVATGLGRKGPRKVTTGGGTRLVGGSQCPAGTVPVDGECRVTGIRGTVERILPGGKTGVRDPVPSTRTPMLDDFGVPAVTPMVVGTITRKDGTVGDILRCGPGEVLGKNDLCYRRGSIPPGLRKWKPARKPPISAKQWRMLQGASTAENRAKEVAQKAGWKVTRK